MFSRINPFGWAVNDILTSAQMNALDIDHANAIDGIDGGTYVETAAVTLEGGIPVLIISGAGTTAQTASGGRFSLGDNDYPTLDIPHSGSTQVRTKSCPSGAMFAATWTVQLRSVIRFYLEGGGTTDLVAIPLDDILQNGETLTTVALRFAISNNHAGGLPAVQPHFFIERYKNDGTNSSAGSATLAAGTISAYYDGGADQVLSATGLTEVVDKTQYHYVLLLADESGINSEPDNQYVCITTTATIADLRPF